MKTRLAEELSGRVQASGIQLRIKRKDGSIIEARLYVSPLIDAFGQQTGWMTSMIDITEPNRVREQLAASHERFTTVLEALDASISVAPLGNDELLFANKLYRLWFGTHAQGTCNWWRKPVCRRPSTAMKPRTWSICLPGCPPTTCMTKRPRAPRFTGEPGALAGSAHPVPELG
jgi:hypothetical protein